MASHNCQSKISRRRLFLVNTIVHHGSTPTRHASAVFKTTPCTLIYIVYLWKQSLNHRYRSLLAMFYRYSSRCYYLNSTWDTKGEKQVAIIVAFWRIQDYTNTWIIPFEVYRWIRNDAKRMVEFIFKLTADKSYNVLCTFLVLSLGGFPFYIPVPRKWILVDSLFTVQ